VCLAQRVSMRAEPDQAPAGAEPVAGRSAIVTVEPGFRPGIGQTEAIVSAVAGTCRFCRPGDRHAGEAAFDASISSHEFFEFFFVS